MPNIISSLTIDRVDLVDEGANSAAFIELFKRKEQAGRMDLKEILAKMKPEHVSVVEETVNGLTEDLNKANDKVTEIEGKLTTANADLTSANDALAKAKAVIALYKACDYCSCDGEEDEDGMCKACGKPKKKKAGFDEEETLKSMPAEAREMFTKMREQKEAAEETLRKAKEAEKHAEAVAKAATLKSLPIESEKLIGIVKNADADLLDCLSAVNAALDGVVLDEVGKSRAGAGASNDTWGKIEAEAENVMKRDNVTKQKAISIVIKEKPELYQEYLKEV